SHQQAHAHDEVAGPNILFLSAIWQEDNEELTGMVSVEALEENYRRAEQAEQRKAELGDSFTVRARPKPLAPAQPDPDRTSDGKRFEDLSQAELDALSIEDTKAWCKWKDRKQFERKEME